MLVFIVALFTVTARCLRLWGGVVLVAVFWGMLSLLTGVGGALSDRGREMPVKARNKAGFQPEFHGLTQSRPLVSIGALGQKPCFPWFPKTAVERKTPLPILLLAEINA